MREVAPGPNGRFIVCRYTFQSGYIVEFTHGPTCIQPPELWIEAHRRSAETAIVDSYESVIPVNREG